MFSRREEVISHSSGRGFAASVSNLYNYAFFADFSSVGSTATPLLVRLVQRLSDAEMACVLEAGVELLSG